MNTDSDSIEYWQWYCIEIIIDTEEYNGYRYDSVYIYQTLQQSSLFL